MDLTIHCGYNANEETINFGNRGLADNESYETATLATLKKPSTLKDAPFINAKIVDGQLYYSINSFFGIFIDREYSASEFSHDFQVIIDNIVISPNKYLVLIFLRNGSFNVLRKDTNGYTIVKTMFLMVQESVDEKYFNDCYLEYSIDDQLLKISIIAVLKNGQIFRITVGEKDAEITASINLIHNFDCDLHISAFSNPFLFVEGTKISILDLSKNNTISIQTAGITHAQFANSNIIALLKTGKLLYICPFTLCYFEVDTDICFHNISVLVDERTTMKCIIAESIKDEYGESNLHYLNPDFTIKYSLKMSNEIYLINPEKETDDIQYISLFKNGNSLEEFRFKCIYETDPEKRLYRLMRRNMISEAEKFARTHNIDMKIFYKEKILLYFEKIKCTTQEIDDLINTLKYLDDHKFILECCITVVSLCDNPDDVLRILKYGCDLEVDKKNPDAKESHLLCMEIYRRFKLFLSLGYDLDKWAEFSEYFYEVKDELKDFLQQKEISKAILVYNYIDTQPNHNINKYFVEEIIDILSNLHVDIFTSFLPTFFNVTLKRLPEALSIFANWIEKNIFEMESSNPDDFPQNAIDFLQNSKESININNLQHVDEYESHFGNLLKLEDCLNNLKELKLNYGVTITLKEWKQEPRAVIRVLLNLKLPLHFYNKMLQDFAYQFMLKNGLDPDEILLNEICDLLNYEESYWADIVSSILHCISSIEQRIKAVEKILLTASIPWRSTIRQIAIQTLNYTHNDVCKIRKIMENEPWMIVLSRKEYAIKNFTMSYDCLQFIVNRIIYCNLPTMEDDLFRLCQNNQNLKVEVVRLLFHHYFERREFEKAFGLLEDHKVAAKKCLELILEDIIALCEFMDISELTHYSSAVNILTEKYYSIDGVYKPGWQKKVNLLKEIFNFNIHFDLDLIPDEITQDQVKSNLTNELITKIVTDYEDGVKSISDVVDSCDNLSLCSGEIKEKLLLQCCTTVHNNKNEILERIIEEFLKYSNNAKYLAILTVYLLQNINITLLNQTMENSFIDYNSSSDNSFCQSLQSAQDLITKAVSVSNSQELIKCLKIVPWVDSIYFIKRQMKEGENNMQLFDESFDFNKINPNNGSISAIQRLFNMYTSFIAQFGNEEHEFLIHFNQNQETVPQDDFLDELHDFQRVVLALNQDGESLLSYRLLTTLQNQLMAQQDLDERILKAINEITKTQCIPNLVHTSLLMGSVNVNLLHISLTWCDSKDTKKYVEYAFRFNRKIPSRMAKIARIGVTMFDYHKSLAEKNYCQEVLVSVDWWEKVKHLKIDYNKFFNSNSTTRLEMLIRTDNFDHKLIKKYCVDYKLKNSASFYVEYLKNLLLNWKPNYKIVTSNIGKRKLVMEENQDEELYLKCTEVVKLIDININKLLHDVWGQVNFYHYEVFACILNICDDQSFKHLRNMLAFLKEYERINEPSDTEKEKWTSSFPQSQVIDPLSEFRLLFNYTIMNSKDIWNIIRKEISMENYNTWFMAVLVLNHLTIDNICSFLVKEIIAQDFLKTIKPGEWLYPKHTDLFSRINDCLQHMENVELKISAAYCLLSNTPEGADQVTIAKITYEYALQYKNLGIGSNEAISFEKIEKKYQKCLCLQILHINNLAEQTYEDLILDGEKLLTALYYDERILEQKTTCPDINKATEQLAEIQDLDVKIFRKRLIKNWLMDSEYNFDKNISMGFSDESSFMKKSTSKESDNLKRAAYVCSSDLVYWAEYLLKEGFLENVSPDSNSYYRSRCLKCLISMADVQTIELLTSMDYASFMSVVDKQTLSSILFKFNILDYDGKSWKVITKKLARIGNPESIKALAQTCIILNITKVNYWEYIIKSANMFGMFSDLVEYLEYTKDMDCRHDKFYLEAWKRLIDHTINVTLSSNKEEIDTNLIKDLFMIQKCPVLFLLDLESICQKCFHAKKFGAVAFLIQYIPKEKTAKALENLKNNISLEDILKELEILESHGLVTMTIKHMLYN